MTNTDDDPDPDDIVAALDRNTAAVLTLATVNRCNRAVNYSKAVEGSLTTYRDHLAAIRNDG